MEEGGDRLKPLMAVPARMRLISVLVAVVVITIPFSGCLGDDGGGEVTATVTIDFNGPEGSINPGNTTIWKQVNGEWVMNTTENENGTTIWIFIDLKCEPNVLALLNAASEVAGFSVDSERYGYMGSLVTAIDGIENESPGRGWQYDVNGEYALEAADKHEIVDGDKVLWKFATSPW